MSDTGAQRTGAQRPGLDRTPDEPKAPLAERLQNKISEATRDYRANAAAKRDELPAPVAPASPATTGDRAPRGTSRSSRRTPRRARLRLTRIDPWSVMKISFLLSVAYGIVTVVAVTMVWSVLSAAGVWSSINTAVNDVLGKGSTFDVTQYLSTSRVLGFTMLVSAIDVVLLTAIATLLAFLYNMAASLLGGIEVTLAEDPH